MKGIMLTHGHKSYPCHGFRPNSWTTDTDCSRASQRVCPYPLCLSHHSTDHIIGLILWCTCRKRVFLNALHVTWIEQEESSKPAGVPVRIRSVFLVTQQPPSSYWSCVYAGTGFSWTQHVAWIEQRGIKQASPHLDNGMRKTDQNSDLCYVLVWHLTRACMMSWPRSCSRAPCTGFDKSGRIFDETTLLWNSYCLASLPLRENFNITISQVDLS
jgi:hypothetical protein